MNYFKLNNGLEVPVIGIGTNTFGKVDGDFYGDINFDTTELKTAILAGYRLIDTATMYRNEAVIGKAVKESGIDRSAFFITSKIPGTPEATGTDELVHKSVQYSLDQLDLSYIDLYLIHHPWDDLKDMLRVWTILETYVEKGLIRSLGVSNFSNEQLDYLIKHAKIKPTVNQIQSHPDDWHDDIIDFCLNNDVIPEAWGPLKRISDTSLEIITKIANKYNKTWAQVILNYQVNRGVLVIPKSHNSLRQKQNLDIFDFTLTKEEKQVLKSLI